MDAVEEVKQRLAIEDVIGEYVQLKRAGRNWKGLSPFSSERTPSFVVSPEKQIWHDFSSGRGGSMFDFVMEVEGLDFKGALELLARKAGVDLEQFRGNSGGGQHKERLYAANELATKFYQRQLTGSREALAYSLGKRAFSKQTIVTWRLGYSPNTGRALSDFLHGKGFTDQEIAEAGLSSQRSRGRGDMFRGRLMIPLCDPTGRVIGFTARLLADNPNAPKYINTPQTALYDKSRHVFGLHLAKEAIRKIKYAVIAEGNLDVITSHQAEVRQVVATAGTALTEGHLKALSRFTADIRLSFDADKAGLNATERAIPIASKTRVSLSIITIPSGKDPDDLIRLDPQQWQAAIDTPQYALDWLMARYETLLDLTSAAGKREFSDVLLAVVRELEDPVEQEHYVGLVAERLSVSRDALQKKLASAGERAVAPLKTTKSAQPSTPTNREASEYGRTQNHLLALTLLQPKLRDTLTPFTTDMLTGEGAKRLLEFLLANPDFIGQADAAEPLRASADYVKMLSLLYEELYQGLDLLELRYEATRLQGRLIEQYVKMQKQRLGALLRAADEADTMMLLEKAKRLDILLNQHKGGSDRG